MLLLQLTALKSHMETLSITWSEVENLIDILANKISKTKKEFDSISTVSRGGLIPARLMADRLGIQKIYVDQDHLLPGSLFVDDIYDTGKTFKKIIKKTKNPDELIYATLFARIGKNYPKQLIYAKLTQGDEYIIHPWEKREQKPVK